MTEIHCTAKLSKRLPESLKNESLRCTNRLGPWCANLFYIGRVPTVIVTNEKTLISVVVPFKEKHTLWERVVISLDKLLSTIGIPEGVIRDEIDAMRSIYFIKNANRSVLGSMNDFIFQATAIIADHPNISFDEVSRMLSEIPCSPLGYGYPREAVKILLVKGIEQSER